VAYAALGVTRDNKSSKSVTCRRHVKATETCCGIDLVGCTPEDIVSEISERWKHFTASSFKDIFKSIDNQTIICFITNSSIC